MLPPLTIILVIVILILVVWLGVVTYLLVNQRSFFRQFTADVTKKDLMTVLKNIVGSLTTLSDEINKIHAAHKLILKADEKHFQKMGFMRYNPFSDTGGDQSFCLCLLDQNNNGFIITSLHSREQTRLYAKTVKDGHLEGIELSKEEDAVLRMAMKQPRRSV